MSEPNRLEIPRQISSIIAALERADTAVQPAAFNAHKGRHAAGGEDPLTPADIGAATAASVEQQLAETIANANSALQPGEAATPAQGVLADNAVQPEDIRAITVANLPTTATDGDVIQLSGFWPGSSGGSGPVVWEASRAKTEHNGGTIIDPGKVGQLASWPGTYFTAAESGTGCWVRRDSDSYSVACFGVRGGEVAGDTQAMQAAIDVMSESGGGTVTIGPGRYLCSGIQVPPNVCFEGAAWDKTGQESTVLVAASEIEYFGSAVSSDTHKGFVFLANEYPLRGGTVRNIHIDMTDAPAQSYGVEIAGLWYWELKNVGVHIVNADQIGIYTRKEVEGVYHGLITNTLVTGTAGTAYKFSDDDPDTQNAGGGTNQVTVTQARALGVDTGFHLNGCGAGMLFLNCQAEVLAGGAAGTAVGVKVENNSNLGYPRWIGGEVNNAGTAFDGIIQVENASVNNVTTRCINGAYYSRHRLGSAKIAKITPTSEVWSEGVSHNDITVLTTATASAFVKAIPASTPTAILRFPATSGIVSGAGTLILQVVGEVSSQFRNASLKYFVAYRRGAVSSLTQEHAIQLESAVEGLAISLTNNGINTYHDLVLEHTGAYTVQVRVFWSGVCALAPIEPS